MKLSNFDHASWVCNWHNQEQQAADIGPDRVWAQKWLAEIVRGDFITPDQANDIRRACGWDIEPVQLGLL